MDHTSLWTQISAKTVNFPSLDHDLEVDVAIIGGGITGITAACQLVKVGQKVALIESKTIGSGTTGNSTGNLYIPVQPLYQNISSKFDLETAKKIAHSRQYAIDYIEQNVVENHIHCDFTRRSWYGYSSDVPSKTFLNEIDVFEQMEVGIEEVQNLPFSLPFKKAVAIPHQARFNPLQYLISMAESLSKKGCEIYENTHVLDFKETNHCILVTAKAKIKAKKVIIATHTPLGVNAVQFFIAPYRSYVIAVTLKDNNYPEGHLWDFGKTYHSICTHAASSENPTVLMVAGSHHKTGQSKNYRGNYEELKSFLRQNFDVEKIQCQWSAQHYQSADTVPYIGLAHRFAKHTYMATGFFADGLIYGTLAGIILADNIVAKGNTLTPIYQSKRFKLVAAFPFLFKHNSNVFWEYLKDWPKGKKIDYKEIQTGQGRIVEVNKEKWAVSRDEQNNLHVVSAVCPHMKCIVNWNDAERTWDCPCHGSRFTCEGKVIEGPAIKDLAPKS